MSIEDATQWIVKLKNNDKLRKQANSHETFEDWQNLAREQGFEFSKEEMEKAASVAAGELTDDDLDSVSGGMTFSGKNDNISGSDLNMPGISIGGRIGTGL